MFFDIQFGYGHWMKRRSRDRTETWQKPVINTTDLSRSLERAYICVIAIKVVSTDICGSGDYDHATGSLSGISLWYDGDWAEIGNVDELEAPLEFEAIPSIFGETGVRFAVPDLTVHEVMRADGKRSRSLFGFIRRLIS